MELVYLALPRVEMSMLRVAEPSKECLVMLDSLKTAVAHALEKKRRLGQYAVMWKNGRPVRVGGEASEANANSQG